MIHKSCNKLNCKAFCSVWQIGKVLTSLTALLTIANHGKASKTLIDWRTKPANKLTTSKHRQLNGSSITVKSQSSANWLDKNKAIYDIGHAHEIRTNIHLRVYSFKTRTFLVWYVHTFRKQKIGAGKLKSKPIQLRVTHHFNSRWLCSLV